MLSQCASHSRISVQVREKGYPHEHVRTIRCRLKLVDVRVQLAESPVKDDSE